MKLLFRTAWGEALIIVTAAAVLGLTYTGMTKRGLFRNSLAPGQTSAPVNVTSTFLTYEEARTLYFRGNVLFVDARHPYDFGLGHIKGAVNLPLQEYDSDHQLVTLIPKDTLLVTYCDGEECNSSVALASKLSSAGFTNVRVFFGGWKEWIAHQQPAEP